MENGRSSEVSNPTPQQLQQETSPTLYEAAEDARYTATRRRRQLLMDDSDDEPLSG